MVAALDREQRLLSAAHEPDEARKRVHCCRKRARK